MCIYVVCVCVPVCVLTHVCVCACEKVSMLTTRGNHDDCFSPRESQILISSLPRMQLGVEHMYSRSGLNPGRIRTRTRAASGPEQASICLLCLRSATGCPQSETKINKHLQSNSKPNKRKAKQNRTKHTTTKECT